MASQVEIDMVDPAYPRKMSVRKLSVSQDWINQVEETTLVVSLGPYFGARWY
jgi:hypothetical protein